jgi:acetyl-CoA acetyltransferase
MGERVFVIGVGMTKFEKPGSRDWDYPDMGREAGEKALADAGISYEQIEQAIIGYCYGDSTCGERALYQLGLTGIPAVNVNNNCSTGSSALYLTKRMIEGGIVDCALAMGFEKMEKGSLGIKYTDRATPMDKHLQVMIDKRGFEPSPPAAQMFGNAGREHMERYGTSPESFARIGEKNHRHSVNNPYAQFQTEYTLDEILAAPMVHAPLTKLQCCPTSDGGGAAVLASERFVREHGLGDQAVEITGMALTTDFASSFEGSDMKLVGVDMTRAAAQQVYEQSGKGPEDVDVIELHDCFSANEMITYEGLGLCKEGGAGELIDSGAVTYGGDWVVNPSGGLISKGHPLGATGLAQCAELTWQLRGDAEKRQVEGATVALQHNLGLGGACVVTMYEPANLG